MTDRDNRQADDLEEHAEQKRREIGRTIDSLEHKLSPGQLFEEVVSTVRSQGGGFGRNLADSVRENPLPLIVTGVGLAWLMVSSGEGGRGRQRRYADDDDGLFDGDMWGSDEEYDEYDDEGYANRESRRRRVASGSLRRSENERMGRGGADSAPGSFKTPPHAAPQRVEGDHTVELQGAAADERTVRRIDDDVNEDDDGFFTSSDDGGRDTGESLGQKRRRAQRHMRERGARMRRQTRRGAERAADQAREYFQEQPLVAGALGIALGAALGAMLPPTRAEDRHLGERSDRVTNRVRREAESAMQQGRREVEQKAEQTRRQAESKAEAARSREAGEDSESERQETEAV